MTLLKVKQGHLDRYLGSSQFFRLLLRLQVIRSITFKYLHARFKRWVQWCSFLRVHVNISFDLFWNVSLFLRLNKGFRSFNLFSNGITKSDFLLFANAMVSCNVSCWAQLVGVFLEIQMLNSLRWSFTDCFVRRNKKTNVQSLYWSFGLIDIST